MTNIQPAPKNRNRFETRNHNPCRLYALLILFVVAALPSTVWAQSAPVKISGTMPDDSDVYTQYGWSNFQLSRDGRHVVFVADIEADEQFEIYSAPVDGSSPPVRLSRTLPGANSMIFYWYEITPDSRRVVFTAEQSTVGNPQLYSIEITGEGLIEIPLPEGSQGVWNFAVSPDSKYVVYRPDPEPVHGGDLYVANVFVAMTPRKLSLPSLSGAGVGRFKISPDGGYVVYTNDQDTPGVDELYIVSIHGGATTKLNSLLNSDEELIDFEVGRAGTYVYYLVERGEYPDSHDDLYAAPMSGVGAQRLNSTEGGEGSTVRPYFQITPSGQQVVYTADIEGDGIFHLYRGTPGEDSVQLDSGTDPADYVEDDFALSPDGNWVAYRQYRTDSASMELFAVPLLGGTPTRINDDLVENGNVGSFEVTTNAGQTTVAYLADQDEDGIWNLYARPLSSTSTVKLSDIGSGGEILDYEMAPDASQVIFRADRQSDDVYELFSVPTAGGEIQRLNSAMVSGGDVHDYAISADSGRIVFTADAELDEKVELFATATTDIEIVGLEVTQGIQRYGVGKAPLPLVAGKETWVRVYMRSSQPLCGVSGALTMHMESGQQIVLQPANSPVCATTEGSHRGQSDETLNFRIPPQYSRGAAEITAAIRKQALIEANTSNNSLTESIAFEEREPLNVMLVRIKYHNLATDVTYEPAEADYAASVDYLKTVFPIPHVNLYFPQANPVLLYESSVTPENNFQDSSTAMNGMLTRLAEDAFACEGVACPSTYVRYGYMDDLCPFSYASGLAGSTSSIGKVYLEQTVPEFERGGIMAHEIAHNFGQSHTSNDDQYPDYVDELGNPLPPGSIGEYGFDPRTQAVFAPQDVLDLMATSGRIGLHPWWISPYRFEKLYEKFAPTVSASASTRDEQVDYMLVIAHVSDGGATGQLGTIYVRPKLAGTNLHMGEGGYRLVTQNANGETLFVRYFEPPVANAVQAAQDDTSFSAAEILPVIEGTTRVLLYSHEQLLDSRTVSPHVPEVAFVEPSPSGSIQGVFNVAWIATDADGDVLTYVLQYSSDGGMNWSPVVSGLTNTSYLIDPANLSKTEAGRLRVLVTDGFNTTSATTPYTFTVPGKPPTAAITAPELGQSFIISGPVTLQGLAFDMDEGAINNDSAYSWHSNRDGDLGIGRQISVQNLSAGEHEITLTVRDQDGLESNAITFIRIISQQTGDDPISELSVEGERTARIGDELVFSAFVVTGTNVYYAWDWGDGTTSLGQTVTHQYSESGVYPVTVRAINEISSDSLTLHVEIDVLTTYLPIAMKAYPLLSPQEAIRIDRVLAQPVRHGATIESTVQVQLRNTTTQTVAVEWPECLAGTLRASISITDDVSLAEAPVSLRACTLYAGEILNVDMRVNATGLAPNDYPLVISFITGADATEEEIDTQTSLFEIVPQTDGIMRLETGATSQLLALDFVNENTGWVVGQDRTILYTSDGGATWTRQQSGSGELLAVEFIDETHGWAAGTEGTDNPIILITDDAGAHWDVIELSYGLWTLQFSDREHGWALGRGPEKETTHIWKTDDGGLNWSSTPIRSPLMAFFHIFDASFIDRTHAWLVVWWDTRLLTTTDEGNTWTHLPPVDGAEYLTSVEFVSTLHGWAGGEVDWDLAQPRTYMLFESLDGGHTWSEIAILDHSINEDSIYMLDEQNGLFRGDNYVMFTDDGGQHWTEWGNVAWVRQRFPPPEVAQLVTPDVAYLIGEGGVVFKYTRAN